MPHVLVIGAGISGVTAAYALIKKGFSVTVLERQRYAAMETSFANGGQLSACNAEVWNHSSNLIKAMKWMTRQDAPLLLSLSPSWHKYSWFAEFLKEIKNYESNTVATVRLALLARQRMFEIAEREKIDFDLEKRGILHIYRDREGFSHAQDVNRLLAEGGLERHPVTPEEMKKIEPTLRGDYFGGFFTPSDATGDIHKFTRGLAEACARQGASFLYETNVRNISVTDEGVKVEFESPQSGANEIAPDAIVICAGVESRDLAAKAGDRVNIYPVKGYSITVDLDDDTSRAGAPWVSLLDDATKIVSSRFGKERLRVAGTAEFAGKNLDIRASRIEPLIAWVRTLFPDVSTERVVPWAGLRPMTPSLMPRFGQGRHPRVFYHTGHGHLGWTLSAGTAHLLAEVMGERSW